MGGIVERIIFKEMLEIILDESDLAINVCLPVS